MYDLDRFDIHNNFLYREADNPDPLLHHRAMIPDTLQTWFDAIAVTYTYGQEDILPPHLTLETDIPLIASTPFHETFTVSEDSYAVSYAGSGL